MDQIIVISSNFARMEDAQRLATELLDKQWIACTNAWPLRSHYVWDGKRMAESEVRMEFKTSEAFKLQVLDYLRAQHPYDIPYLAVAFQEVDPHYAKWVYGQLKA